MCDNSFARADIGKMRAANESYALKMNIIVILTLFMSRVLTHIYSAIKSGNTKGAAYSS